MFCPYTVSLAQQLHMDVNVEGALATRHIFAQKG